MSGSAMREARPRDRSAREFLTCLASARRSSTFYPPEHPAVRLAIEDLDAAFRRLAAGRPTAVLTFYEGDLVFEDRVLTEESVLFDQLIRDLNMLGIDSVEIAAEVTRDELSKAVRILAADIADVEAAGGIERMIDETALSTIRFGRVVLSEPDVGWEQGKKRARRAYQGAVGLVRELDGAVRSGGAIPGASVRAAASELVDGVLQQRTAMLELTALRDWDEYTFYHSANVAILALGLGSLITQDRRFLTSLGTGALLHDVGKLVVGRDLLNKAGSLTPEEWQMMRMHPVAGARIVGGVPGLDRSAALIALEHHMAYNASGYPKPPHAATARQHLASRIVAIADAYDAMTSKRSYSSARSQTEAMRVIAENAGQTLDPALVRLFITMLGVYPPRSVVRLDDGRTAIVISPAEGDPARPTVRVVAKAGGDLTEEPYDMDLAEEGSPSIERYLEPAALNIEVDHYL